MAQYGTRFYQRQMGGSETSARAVLPLVFDLVRPASVVDFGCGVGTWLSVARSLGATRISGLDGAYVDRTLLRIPEDAFTPTDLERVAAVAGFDLALSLEVAEHLSAAAAPRLVDALCGSAPVVLFGAAVPGQRGRRHVNCQWQSWWARLFAERGFLVFDPLRVFWARDDVQYWYTQNARLYVRRGHGVEGALRGRLPPVEDLSALDVVHPKLYQYYVDRFWRSPGGFVRRLIQR